MAEKPEKIFLILSEKTRRNKEIIVKIVRLKSCWVQVLAKQ